MRFQDREISKTLAEEREGLGREAVEGGDGHLQMLFAGVFDFVVADAAAADWTNIITVGMPARETSAASCSGPEGRRCVVPRNFADGLVAKIEQRGMQRR